MRDDGSALLVMLACFGVLLLLAAIIEPRAARCERAGGTFLPREMKCIAVREIAP